MSYLEKGTDLVSSKYNQQLEGANKGLFAFYNSRTNSVNGLMRNERNDARV